MHVLTEFRRPVCGPCEHAGRGDDCEYADAQGRSRTQTLLDTISRLETRVQELESPSTVGPNVPLFEPRQGSPGPTLTGPASPADSEFYRSSAFPLSWQITDPTQLLGSHAPPTTIWDAEDLPADASSELYCTIHSWKLSTAMLTDGVQCQCLLSTRRSSSLVPSRGAIPHKCCVADR